MQLKQILIDYPTLSDGVLAERSRDGDADAFTELYRRYLTPFYRFIFRRVGGDVALAEDLTSQVFLETLDHLNNYRERGRFVAWLFTIARRRLIDVYRKSEMDSLDMESSHGVDTRQRACYLYREKRIEERFSPYG